MSDRFYTIPVANRYEVCFCGDCPNAHLLFFNAENTPICQATMSAQQADALGKLIRSRDPNFRETSP